MNEYQSTITLQFGLNSNRSRILENLQYPIENVTIKKVITTAVSLET